MHIEIFTDVSKLLIEDVMRYEQLADIMDFLGFKGFKREIEYYYLKSGIELRGIHRYAINHFNKLIIDKDIPTLKIIPTSWEGATRQQVDESVRKKYVKQFFNDWKESIINARTNYSTWYKRLVEEGHIDASYKILCLLKDNEKEIKCLERQIIEYESVSWDMTYIMFKQDEIHDCYHKKSKELGVDIC